MVDKYAVLLARGERQHGEKSIDKGVRLGQFHPRGTLLPFAVSVDGGQQKFKASKLAGCSSLLNFTSREVMGNKGDWAPFCRNILEERVVDTISAKELAALLPRSYPIRMIKIDGRMDRSGLRKRL